MAAAPLSVTVPQPVIAPHNLASNPFSQPFLRVERAALEAVRFFFRWADMSGPVQAWLAKRELQILRNVPYLGSGDRAHLLDVYRAREASVDERRPVVLYVHGGGFEVCSKDTHWMMASAFAQNGYVVFSINYRLAPEHPFPNGLKDVCAAYLWVLDNAERFGGDRSRVVVAGESAGANLVSSLALINCIERPEPWARAVFRRDHAPTAVVAACGLYEVSNAHRFRKLADRSWPITKHAIEQVGRAYLPELPQVHGEHDLANPLRMLESPLQLQRPLAPFFVPCGTDDPILHDSLRLEAALKLRGVEHEARYYDGEIHAFHVMWWRSASKALWEDTLRFLCNRFEQQKEVTSSIAA